MRRTKPLWWSLASVSFVVTLGMITGFGYAIQQEMFPRKNVALNPAVVSKPSNNTNDEKRIDIVALGDSLTVGFGDSLGQGYVGRLRQSWSDNSDVPVYVTANVARNGAKAAEVLETITSRPGLQEAVQMADVIVFTAGGNDLYQFGEDIEPKTFISRIPPTVESIRKIYEAIRQYNPTAMIYYIGLYNPFVSFPDQASIIGALRQWNRAVEDATLAYKNIVFVPTYDLFQQDTKKYLASDNYHLNDLGYDRVAQRLLALVRSL